MTEYQDITAPVGAYSNKMHEERTHNRRNDLATVVGLMKQVPPASLGFDRVPSADEG